MAVALQTAAQFTSAIARARDVSLSSYMLHRGAVLDALVAAARRGAHVRVRLEGAPFEADGGPLQRINAASAAALRAAGAGVEFTHPGERAHLKAAVVDGTAWLDGRNWGDGANELIVRDDDRADADAVAHAVAGATSAGGTPSIATAKAEALRFEADVIERAGAKDLCIETESFGTGSIYGALLRRAEAHLPTRLIVAGREAGEAHGRTERSCLARLAALGVEVRAGNPRRDLNDKLAVAGDEAWAGSANATYAGGAAGAQSDWGLVSRDACVVDGLRAAFERNWAQARAFAPSATDARDAADTPQCDRFGRA